MALKEEILRLIALKQEGGYWDFKKQWHTKKMDLLHDIICLANNLYNRDAYIIIGIDEKEDFAIIDITADQNRKNTQNMVDFLKDKKFAGGIRPLVYVESISINNKVIDVIVIENSKNTPFYLTDHFEGIRANHIYTRVMDTNTPIDKSADINNVECLWRKRFHIDEKPIDKFNYFLKNPDDWGRIQDHDMSYFYKYAPEYTFSCEPDDRDGYEYYILGQLDTQPSWWMITLKYHQTAIAQFLGLALDGGRSFVIAPDRARDLMTHESLGVGFYIKSDLNHQLLEFFHCLETVDQYSYEIYMRAIIIFESKNEYERFICYVKANMSHYKELFSKQDVKFPAPQKLKGEYLNTLVQNYRDALVLKKMLEEFRHTSTLNFYK